jgi:3-deoxy-D-manno-octulosonate 8-phosphate phosphatase (KDO 8-P phosphatase)
MGAMGWPLALQQADVTVALLSGGHGDGSENQARHLDIHHCRVGVHKKIAGLEQLRQELTMVQEQTAVLGDDRNDLPIRAATGLLITPADAAPSLRRQADWIMRRRGGNGALREFSEALFASQGWIRKVETSGLETSNGPLQPFTSEIRFLSCRDQPKAAAAPKTGRGAGTDVGAEPRGVAIA